MLEELENGRPGRIPSDHAAGDVVEAGSDQPAANILAGGKRKRGTRESPGMTIQIKSDSSALFQCTTTLTPVRLIKRHAFPLDLLDPSQPPSSKDGQSSLSTRLFTAKSSALEHSKGEAKVMLAKLDTDKALHVVEEIGDCLFSLSRLHRDVTEKDVRALRDCTCALGSGENAGIVKQNIAPGPDWWRIAAVVPSNLPLKLKSERPRPVLAMLTQPRKPDAPGSAAAHSKIRTTSPSTLGGEMPLEQGLVLETPSLEEPVFDPVLATEQLLTQYLDAVYLSKTSLAYFAKGPVSRARAAFTTAAEAAASTGINADAKAEIEEGESITAPDVHLLRALKSAICAALIPLAVSDRKYRDTIPKVVHDPLTATLFSNPNKAERNFATAARKRRTKAVKNGIGKPLKPTKTEGLFIGEDAHIRRWWWGGAAAAASAATGEEIADENIQSAAGDASEAALTKRIVALRTRETLAQMILACEAMAIDDLILARDTAHDGKDWASATRPNGNLGSKRQQEKAAGVDLMTQIELLVDKLCIWQAIDEDIVQAKSTGQTPENRGKSGRSRDDKNILVTFCVEVLMPFYCSRLPVVTRLICSKLGCPLGPSPKKRVPDGDSRKSEAPSAKRPKKADPSKDSGGQRSGKSVATKSIKPPSLLRSATDSMLNQHSGISKVKDEDPAGVSEKGRLKAIPSASRPSFKRSASTTQKVETITKDSIAARTGQHASSTSRNLLKDQEVGSRSRSASASLAHFHNREIDLCALSRATADKAKRRQKIEKDLQDAIAILKKPDRRKAVSNEVQDRERRRGVPSAETGRRAMSDETSGAGESQAKRRRLEREKERQEQAERDSQPLVFATPSKPVKNFQPFNHLLHPESQQLPGYANNYSQSQLSFPGIERSPMNRHDTDACVSSTPLRSSRGVIETPSRFCNMIPESSPVQFATITPMKVPSAISMQAPDSVYAVPQHQALPDECASSSVEESPMLSRKAQVIGGPTISRHTSFDRRLGTPSSKVQAKLRLTPMLPRASRAELQKSLETRRLEESQLCTGGSDEAKVERPESKVGTELDTEVDIFDALGWND